MKTHNFSTTRDEIVAYNGWKELLWYWWPTVKDTISPNTPVPIQESCSAFIATGNMTTDGKIVLGHNTWDDYCIPVYNIIIDISPSSGNKILMQSAAGHIHSGTDFFITSAGIIGAETTIGGFFPFNPDGAPEFSRVRRAMQDAHSIEEWCEIMKKGNSGAYANSWLIGDINTNEIARLELGLKYVGFEKKSNGYFSGSNIADDLNILRKETTINETDIRNSNIARKVRWEQLMKEYTGKIDVEKGKEMLSDHYDTFLGVLKPDSRTICGHVELDDQTYGILEPFRPIGAYDGKVVNSVMAKNMTFEARWGSSCGMPFDAKKFLSDHPQFSWMKGLIKDRPTQPWTVFNSGETK